jgi:SAM-dependent methyltransferase
LRGPDDPPKRYRGALQVPDESPSSLGSSAKWRAPGRGAWYASTRFRSNAHRQRDPRAIEALLGVSGLELDGALVLDAGCGTARLRDAIESTGARWSGLDASREMLAQHGPAARGRAVCGDLVALPFRDRSFDIVVCCRVLHHLQAEAELECAARELLRVARRAVVCSFWDSASWPALRVRLGWKRGEGARGRLARSRAELSAVFERAGGRVTRFRARPRWLDQQTFALVLKETPR